MEAVIAPIRSYHSRFGSARHRQEPWRRDPVEKGGAAGEEQCSAAQSGGQRDQLRRTRPVSRVLTSACRWMQQRPRRAPVKGVLGVQTGAEAQRRAGGGGAGTAAVRGRWHSTNNGRARSSVDWRLERCEGTQRGGSHLLRIEGRGEGWPASSSCRKRRDK